MTEKTTDEPLVNITEMLSEEPPKRVYGWVPDLPSNQKNFLMTAHPSVLKTFPKKMTLDNLPPIYNQETLGSCTANALGAAFQTIQRKQSLNDFMPSRLFIYYNERRLENNIPYDTGAAISDGIKTLTVNGVCREELCPYNIKDFAICPSKTAYRDASYHQILKSMRVPLTSNGMKTLINMNLPIVFGFTVYESFEDYEISKTGIMKLPKLELEKILGGHAVACVGYDDEMEYNGTKGFLLCRNSWGPTWGKDGHFYMPYEFVDKMKLASDAWAIMKNEEPIELNKELSEPLIGKSIISRITDFFRKIPSVKITIKMPED